MPRPDLAELEQQFRQQNAQLARVREALSSLSPSLGLAVDSDWLEALDDTLDQPARARPGRLPLGRRA